MKLSLPHPLAGEVPLIGQPDEISPGRRSGTKSRRRCSASIPRKFLSRVLGMSAEDVALLRAAGAI